MKNTKKIVLCLDGTFNEPIRIRQDSGSLRIVANFFSSDDDHRISRIKQYFRERHWTNVSKIRYLISEINKKENKHQITAYFRGVGSGLDGLDRAISGATGTGLEYQILDAYQFLSDNYVVGDDIYLIGYSRGAIAARAVASMMEVSGLLKGANAGRVNLNTVWKHYFHSLAKGPSARRVRPRADYWADNAEHVHRGVTIKALALWDSVVGGEIEISRDGRETAALFKGTYKLDPFASLFRDTDVPSNVESVFHAMAIDEFRSFFELVPFKGNSGGSGNPIVEQVWFPGSHGNVGGGCNNKSLSDIALAWMIKKLKSAGLQFHDANVKDQVKPNVSGPIYDSLAAEFTGVPPYGYGSKSVRRVDDVGAKMQGEKVHSSVVALWNAKVRVTRQDPTEKTIQDRVAYPLNTGVGRWKAHSEGAPFKAAFVEDAGDYEKFHDQLGKFAGARVAIG